MATRLLRPKLLHVFRRFSTFNSSASSSVTATAVPQILTLEPPPQPEEPTRPPALKKPNSILDLTDHQRLFAAVPTSELIRSCAVLHAAGIDSMVDLGMWVMNSRLMDVPVARGLVLGIVRRTFYEHFCAGEDAAAAARRVRKVYEATGLRGMLVYGVEHAEDGGACDQNMQRFLETVEAAKSLPLSYLSSVVVKITALCPISLLKRVSDLLRWQYKNPNLVLPWKLKTFPVFSDSSPLYHTTTLPEPLTEQEEQDLESAHRRLQTICQKCHESNVPLLIDAEDTILQPAIDYLTYSSAITYNSLGDRPIVYNTIQAYLKDAGERLYLACKGAEKEKVSMGFKLVRGAYMSSESKLASSLGYKSPIHDGIQNTHNCYNKCMSFLLEKVADGSDIGVVLATHNIESGKLAAKKTSELRIEKGNQKIEFAQLYGMCDALSLGLRDLGFNVSKYMPFGPVDTAIPYLLRRAEENRGMLSTSTLDRELMWKELKRRVGAALVMSK